LIILFVSESDRPVCRAEELLDRTAVEERLLLSWPNLRMIRADVLLAGVPRELTAGDRLMRVLVPRVTA
jgi:hypothetical protein